MLPSAVVSLARLSLPAHGLTGPAAGTDQVLLLDVPRCAGSAQPSVRED